MKTIVLFLMVLVICAPLAAQPWGKDAELAIRPRDRIKKKPQAVQDNIGVVLSEVLIQFHKDVISPADGPRSHYRPSSSQYTLDAIKKYGFFRGWMMGCDRLMRENNEDWVYRTIPIESGLTTKFDPVR